ncbi:DNA-directed RNA polymerase I subunit A43 [Exophiala viscosa]|uniref:DNA-directed RNA polymerase subunit n=1 Tax=Exophiala viscosa TaxID=2486360 RepID=A0AAN6DM44_9EURO|nr:DNA-directed RNA polymerase I subunit A43 [Exophiala viscosa]KAI1620977.1 DNA-directed RNA polymerase I subunit A43 [Exophiala viscosa]
MSVRSTGKHASPAEGADSLTSSKKRKHASEDREASKKKKKQRTEVADSVVVAPEQSPTEVAKTKKKKSKDEKIPVEESEEEVPEHQDVELPDALQTQDEQPSTETILEPSSTAVDGDEIVEVEPEVIADLLSSEDPTSFYSTRLSLYLSIPAVSLESSSSSLLATHLAPLLLTYFPPAKGIVLGFSDPVLSAKADTTVNLPLIAPSTGKVQRQSEVLAKAADEYGVCWVWLTATFLVFQPERGDELLGWTNVTSEGFVGLVSYNYFQTAVDKSRIPAEWKWIGPSRAQSSPIKKKGKKGRLRDDAGAAPAADDANHEDGRAENETDSQAHIRDDSGHFADATGAEVPSTLKLRVVDTEVVPAHERNKWSLQIDGTLLDEEAEQHVLDEERAKFERTQQRSRSRTPGDKGDISMTGALGASREGSVASGLSGHIPRHRVAY